MRRSFRLADGGQITVQGGREDLLIRMEVLQRFRRQGADSFVFLHRGEVRDLVVELLRCLKGGDDVVQLAAVPGSMPLDRLVNLVCGETVTPAPGASEEGGPPPR